MATTAPRRWVSGLPGRRLRSPTACRRQRSPRPGSSRPPARRPGVGGGGRAPPSRRPAPTATRRPARPVGSRPREARRGAGCSMAAHIVQTRKSPKTRLGKTAPSTPCPSAQQEQANHDDHGQGQRFAVAAEDRWPSDSTSRPAAAVIRSHRQVRTRRPGAAFAATSCSVADSEGGEQDQDQGGDGQQPVQPDQGDREVLFGRERWCWAGRWRPRRRRVPVATAQPWCTPRPLGCGCGRRPERGGGASLLVREVTAQETSGRIATGRDRHARR